MRTLFDAIGSLAGVDANAVALPLYDLSETAGGPRVGSGDTPVERDRLGVPTAWRLFAFGPVSITRLGQTATGVFTREAGEQIAAYFRQKGAKIPLDSLHFTFELAQKLGVSETQVVELLHSKTATFGFAALEVREDGLWVVDAEYHPLAYRMMQEGTMRYFSPVMRGLNDGRLRITSVTFTNEPATDGLFSLAAEAEAGAIADMDALAASLDRIALSAASGSSTHTKEEFDMEQLLAPLATLLGMDSIALSDDNAVPEDVVGKLNDLAGEIPNLRAEQEAHTAFLATVGDALSLEGERTPATIEAAIRGMAAKAGQADELKTRVDALELEAENEKRDKVVQRGLDEGKLTKAMIESDWGRGQDAAALTAYLATAPVIVPVDQIRRERLTQPDAVALSAEQRGILSMVGVTEKEDQDAAAKL